MLSYPQIDPIIMHIGPLALRWYGLMYSISFIVGFFIIKNRVKLTIPYFKAEQLESLFFWIMIGVLIGARLGELLLYHWMEWKYYLITNPIEIIAIWHGGLSFHGGLIGSCLAITWYIHRQRIPFLLVADAVCLAAPMGLMLGRLGNFINGELFGRVSSLPWAMVFPHAGPLPRHPSQLYEAVLEGPLLQLILYLAHNQSKPGIITVLFLLGYSGIRFLIEFVREPTPQIGFLLGPLTTGHLLSLIQAIAGFIMWYFLPPRKKNNI